MGRFGGKLGAMLGRISYSVRDAAEAMLWLDLHAAGVTAEMAEVRFDWFASPAPAVVAPVAVRAEVAVPLAAPAVAPLLPRAAGDNPGDKLGPRAGDKVGENIKITKPEAKADVWVAGEPGGLVVVMQAAGAPQGRALELFGKMMAAVGHDGAVAWVGTGGTAEAAALVGAVQGLKPLKVLMLGQNILAQWLGKSLGVEGWHASGTPLPGCEGLAVGVTYPPELLLAQPLFKRLAWQHLLKWRAGWELA